MTPVKSNFSDHKKQLLSKFLQNVSIFIDKYVWEKADGICNFQRLIKYSDQNSVWNADDSLCWCSLMYKVGPFEFLEARDCTIVREYYVFGEFPYRLPRFSCSSVIYICGRLFKQHRVYQQKRQTFPLLSIITAKFSVSIEKTMFA